MMAVLSPFIPVDPRLKNVSFSSSPIPREDRKDLEAVAAFLLGSPELLYNQAPSLKPVENLIFSASELESRTGLNELFTLHPLSQFNPGGEGTHLTAEFLAVGIQHDERGIGF